MRAPFILGILLVGSPALAGHLPDLAGGSDGTPISGPITLGDADHAPSSCDPNTLRAWFKDWRQHAREAYATLHERVLAAPNTGATCIKRPEAYDVEYVGTGDYFKVRCLAARRGKLAYLFTLRVDAQPAECLSDQSIESYLSSTQCRTFGNQAQLLRMKACSRALVFPQPFQPADVKIVNENNLPDIISARPEVQNIVDVDTLVVKSSSSTSSGGDGSTHVTPADDCAHNPLLCSQDRSAE